MPSSKLRPDVICELGSITPIWYICLTKSVNFVQVDHFLGTQPLKSRGYSNMYRVELFHNQLVYSRTVCSKSKEFYSS